MPEVPGGAFLQAASKNESCLQLTHCPWREVTMWVGQVHVIVFSGCVVTS